MISFFTAWFQTLLAEIYLNLYIQDYLYVRAILIKFSPSSQVRFIHSIHLNNGNMRNTVIQTYDTTENTSLLIEVCNVYPKYLNILTPDRVLQSKQIHPTTRWCVLKNPLDEWQTV